MYWMWMKDISVVLIIFFFFILGFFCQIDISRIHNCLIGGYRKIKFLVLVLKRESKIFHSIHTLNEGCY